MKVLDMDGLVYLYDKIKNCLKSYYGTCETAAATQAKVVECEGFKLETGTMIRVKFTNAQTYNGTATLNVNGTGAKNITRVGTTATTRYFWSAGEVVDFVYDGVNYIMEGRGIASTSYYGVTKLNSSIYSTSTSYALTPNGLNTALQYIVTGYSPYSTSLTYNIGDRVRYGNYVYECTTAGTTGTWNESKWTIVDPLQTQINNKENSSNKVSSISSTSTNDQYPSAKAVYDLFNSIINGDEVGY